MSIDTQISSFLVPRTIWESGFRRIPPLALPARDALDIERRWRKGVILRNEAKRYAICCNRLQGLVRELAIDSAPIAHVHVWGPYGRQAGPRAVAFMAAMEYLRSSYHPNRTDGMGVSNKANLKYDRLEAIFHPPGERVSAQCELLRQARSESRLAEMCAYAVQRAAVLAGGCAISAEECSEAMWKRHELLALSVARDCGVVDILDLV